MSCLSIRLQPAKKAWKSFTSILQTRLHKLNKSKAIKKPKKKNRIAKSAPKTTRPSTFSGQGLLQLRSRRRRRGLPFGYKRCYISENKAVAPVYVDKLFIDAPVTELVGYIHQQQSEKKHNDEAEDAGTSKQGAIPMASPMLHGVDARAEEFIASFRAEMERQEKLARNL